MNGQLQRASLDFVDGYGRERGVIPLSGANADDTIEGLDEDFPVAHRAGARGADDGVDRRLDERFRAGHLDLDLLVKLEEQLYPAPHRDCVLLAPVTAGAGDGDPGDAGAEQSFLDGGKAVGTDYTADQFHCSPPATGELIQQRKTKSPRVHRSKRGGISS